MKPKRLIVTSSGTPDKDDLPVSYFHRQAALEGYRRANHHYIITRDGVLHSTRASDDPGLSLSGALKKYNLDSLSAMLVGTANYTEAQLAALYLLVIKAMNDGLDVMCHSDLCIEEDSGKPGFSISQLIEERSNDHG